MSDDKIEMLVRAIDSSLYQTTALFSMLLNELYPSDPEPKVDTTDVRVWGVASEDPIKCQHPDPDVMEIMDQKLCNSCGTNLSA